MQYVIPESRSSSCIRARRAPLEDSDHPPFALLRGQTGESYPHKFPISKMSGPYRVGVEMQVYKENLTNRLLACDPILQDWEKSAFFSYDGHGSALLRGS